MPAVWPLVRGLLILFLGLSGRPLDVTTCRGSSWPALPWRRPMRHYLLMLHSVGTSRSFPRRVQTMCLSRLCLAVGVVLRALCAGSHVALLVAESGVPSSSLGGSALHLLGTSLLL